MARATCRCGQPLEVPPAGVEHVTCPKCAARVRIVRKRREGDPSSSSAAPGDGFLRFSCPCGRRLKVGVAERPSHGKCPDCGRVVPVPADAAAASATRNESPTEELAASDRVLLDAWARTHGVGGKSTAEMAPTPPGGRAEAGLRVCPRCGKPVHLNAEACRACGSPVPRR